MNDQPITVGHASGVPHGPLYPFEGKMPVLHPSVFVAPTAAVIGDVTAGEGTNIWYHCVLRGDTNFIPSTGTFTQSVTQATSTTVLTSDINPSAFGHFGTGGAVGFADPEAGIAFGYTMNHVIPRWQSSRNRALIDALYSCL